jgi:tRNA-dihydrouridine synthase B
MSFWNTLKKPILVLAPMADVTDASFRRVIAKYGKPDVIWTEFVSADGLAKASPEGKEKLLRDLLYDESERPIVAQFFGSNPETMYEAGKLAVKLGFDGADINMGCPDKSIMKQKAGAALIRTPTLARQLIQALRKGAEEECERLGKPMIGISVKTRVGFNKVELEEWFTELLQEDLDALIVHCRTMKEMSKVPARWEHVKEAVILRDKVQEGRAKKTLILGNGDLTDIKDARNKVEESGADGAMLGRAIFGNPWLFYNGHLGNQDDHCTPKEKMEVMLEHTKLFEELLGDIKNFAIMKKHYKAYVNGFDGAKELRMKLMDAQTAKEVETFLKNDPVWNTDIRA